MGLFTTSYNWQSNPGATEGINYLGEYQKRLDQWKPLGRAERGMYHALMKNPESVGLVNTAGETAKAIKTYNASQQSTGDASLDAARQAKFAGEAQFAGGVEAMNRRTGLFSMLAGMRNQGRLAKLAATNSVASQIAGLYGSRDQLTQQGPIFDVSQIIGDGLGAAATYFGGGA